jgi:hypothetical protein
MTSRQFPYVRLLLLLLALVADSAGFVFDGSRKKDDDHASAGTHHRLAGEDQEGSGKKTNKRLVIFIGPRKAGSTLVEKFFYTHAGNSAGGLSGWIWPTYDHGSELIPKQVPPHKIFGLYMNQPNNQVLMSILDQGLQKAWNDAEEGVILGTDCFDRVGDTDENSWNRAAPAMDRLVQLLNVPPDRVTIVMNYRTPRLDQWVSLFKHAIHDGGEHYKHFMCQEKFAAKRKEFVKTSMNPLGIANTLIDNYNWNVALVDMEGAAQADMEIGHVILCNVLEQCDNTSLNANFTEDHTENHGFGSLGHGQQQQLEQLFRERDCYYQPILEGKNSDNNKKFTALYPNTLWRGCLDDQSESYQRLADVDTLVNAIQAQKSCGDMFTHHEIDGLLVGDVHTMTESSPSSSGTQEQQQQQQQQQQEEVYNDDDDQIDYQEIEEEPLMAHSKKHKSEDAPVITFFFFLIAIGAGLYQMKLMHPNNANNNNERGRNYDGLEPGGALEFATRTPANGPAIMNDNDDDGEPIVFS